MENKIDEQKILQALKAVALNALVNDYAVERVAFGFEKPGESAPIDLYLEHLRININDLPNKRKDIIGFYIDEQERISAGFDCAEYVRDLFVMQMESIFSDAPKDIRAERDCEDIPLTSRFRDYLFGILPLFTEVLNVEARYDVFDIIPTDKKERATEYPKWKRFVTSILLKPLKSGSRINRYVKDFTCAPHYIRRLIEKRGKNFYLNPIDIDGYEYIFALFSLMRFKKDENDKILELKMLEWERLHKSELSEE